MRCAVPITGGMVSSHFGHCEEFALFDVDEQKKKILGKVVVASPGHQPGLLPEWLAEQGVSLVIAGGMGSRAQNLFQQNHIGVVTGILEGDPGSVVQSYLDGTLSTGPNVCDH
ncbi:MAG: NifB/NifX family molybdenum-iron cluster-binding protein [Dehalococcoidia bacterium]|jgi:ATP-binding protein involved in chromosome partitioning